MKYKRNVRERESLVFNREVIIRGTNDTGNQLVKAEGLKMLHV